MKLRVNFNPIDRVKEAYHLRRAIRGNQDSFGKLYLCYLDQIYRYIFFRVGQEEEIAEDITQEVFIKALKNIEDFKKKKGTFKAWLYAIARNSAIDHIRKSKNDISLKLDISDPKNNLEENLIKKEKKLEVTKAVNQIPKRQQEILILSFVNELSTKEIAKITHKKNGAVRAIKFRALKNLKNILNYEQ